MYKAKINGTVAWVFDDQGRTGKEAVKSYDLVRANVLPEVRHKMGAAPIFRHDKNVLPLKAADLYAWQIRRHLDKEQPNRVAHNDYLDVLAAQVYGVSNVIEGEHMEDFVANIGHGRLQSPIMGVAMSSQLSPRE